MEKDRIVYKWIRDIKTNEVYIVTLYAYHIVQKTGYPLEWYSSECIVKAINSFHNGYPAYIVCGSAYNYVDGFCYEVGKMITGTYVYFCLNMDELMLSQRGGIKYALVEHEKYLHGIDRKYVPIIQNRYIQPQHLKMLKECDPKRGLLPAFLNWK